MGKVKTFFWISWFFLVSTLFAQFSGKIQLNTADVIFIGENSNDEAGCHISLIGDVNDDGYDDILIGAEFQDNNGKTDNGRVYLFFGKAPNGWAKEIDLANADVLLNGEKDGDMASHDVFGVGDVNNDGIDDFAIGLKCNTEIIDGEEALDVGKVYIFFGKKSGWNRIMSLSEANASYIGEEHASQAGHVNGPGDLNGDGFDDLVIGSGFNREMGDDAGKVYIIFGKPTESWRKNVSLNEEDASYLAEMEGDWAGHRIASTGDVNGDGFPDFLIDADGRDTGGTPNTGMAYLILGKKNGWTWDVSLADADASFLGPAIQELRVGWNVCGPGDVNNDGLNDLLIAGQGKSKVYLIFGRRSGWATNQLIENIANVIFTGETSSDHAGYDMRTLGDLNHDGYDDFIIGAYGNSENGTEAGKAYLFYGRSNWSPNIGLANAEAVFVGENAGDHGGQSVAGGGDVNNDGNEDILISANLAEKSETNAGKVFLFFNKLQKIVIDQPNGGEEWPVNSVNEIKWNSEWAGENVRIDFSTDNGTNWKEVVATTPNDGSFLWTIPNDPSSQCLVRITDGDGSPSDMSDGVFTIKHVGMLGDINNDGLVNSTDALIILSCEVGIDVSDYCPMNCGDVNGDLIVNSTDALIIMSYDVGIEVPYSVGQVCEPVNVQPCSGCASK